MQFLPVVCVCFRKCLHDNIHVDPRKRNLPRALAIIRENQRCVEIGQRLRLCSAASMRPEATRTYVSDLLLADATQSLGKRTVLSRMCAYLWRGMDGCGRSGAEELLGERRVGKLESVSVCAMCGECATRSRSFPLLFLLGQLSSSLCFFPRSVARFFPGGKQLVILIFSSAAWRVIGYFLAPTFRTVSCLCRARAICIGAMDVHMMSDVGRTYVPDDDQEK